MPCIYPPCRRNPFPSQQRLAGNGGEPVARAGTRRLARRNGLYQKMTNLQAPRRVRARTRASRQARPSMMGGFWRGGGFKTNAALKLQPGRSGGRDTRERERSGREGEISGEKAWCVGVGGCGCVTTCDKLRRRNEERPVTVVLYCSLPFLGDSVGFQPQPCQPTRDDFFSRSPYVMTERRGWANKLAAQKIK